MNWIEYVQVLDRFRARFGCMPPSILTEDGALDHMRAALSESDERTQKVRRVPPPSKPDA